ncbi:DUF1569 domain-containing protein [Flavobacterium sp.]|uniref:DUF1569 domain-containing protein n=1 Tax=Flavobacterium sp. TaxID=239 RepID=UPI00260A44A4|nr:DUF1569 domain-containing protein [Flavobacterium sp.]
MANIFDKEANAKLLERLGKLEADTKPLWGKMTAPQMVVHCQKPLDVAVGKLVLSGGLLGFLFGKMAKNSFIKNRSFSKNSPTAPEFKISGTPDFEAEKETLMSIIEAFGNVGPDVITNKKHPFFGMMTEEEWGILHYIHLDHHLLQFGL